jgi:hypothetical protein
MNDLFGEKLISTLKKSEEPEREGEIEEHRESLLHFCRYIMITKQDFDEVLTALYNKVSKHTIDLTYI